jgi:putative exporter of polyketide antibiotics
MAPPQRSDPRSQLSVFAYEATLSNPRHARQPLRHSARAAGSFLGIAIGAASAGGDIVTPVLGALVLGMFAMAMAGVGVAFGGLVRSGIAGPVVAIVTIATWLVDIIGPALNLPEPLRDLAQSAHYGLPMVGRWDPTGIVASLIVGIGGVALGAWGFARRDLGE